MTWQLKNHWLINHHTKWQSDRAHLNAQWQCSKRNSARRTRHQIEPY